jgi:hypothetical protein
MANNTHRMHPMPMFIIDNCSTLEDNKELKSNYFPRSLSLINYNQAYKDLSGTIHYSSLNHLKNFFIRSNSCPNEKSFYIQSTSTTIQYEMNLLDPSNGIHSPGGSSSRYSLYGSFIDLSEHSFIKTDNKLLTIDNTSKLSMNTYQDKCNDWLSHLDMK